MRLGGHTHEIVTQTVHETLPESLFCAVIYSQISSKFTGVVVYYPLHILPLVVFSIYIVNCPGF